MGDVPANPKTRRPRKEGREGNARGLLHWRTPDEMAKLQAHGKAEAPAPCYPFVAFVFNLDQTEGIECPADDVPAAKNYPLEEAQKIVDAMPNAEIRHGASIARATTRRVTWWRCRTWGSSRMRGLDFAAVHHELIHSTGHETRLNRFEKRGGESREKQDRL